MNWGNVLTVAFFAGLAGMIPAVIADRKGYGAGWWWVYGATLFPDRRPPRHRHPAHRGGPPR
jgi:hypothetical protein